MVNNPEDGAEECSRRDGIDGELCGGFKVRVTKQSVMAPASEFFFWADTYIEPTLELRFPFVSPMNSLRTLNSPVSFSLRSRPT